MQKRRQWLFGLSIVLMLGSVWAQGRSFAAVRRDLGEDCVAFGEWQPRGGGKGTFLPPEGLAPGQKVAVKIMFDQPGETVTVKFFVETLSESRLQFKKDCQDNGAGDLHAALKIIVIELMEVPATPVLRYIVEVRDRSANDPIVRSLAGSVEPSDFTGRVGKTISDTAGTLWRLPQTIAAQILSKERGLERTTVQPLCTLVIADLTGKPLKTSKPLPAGEIRAPVWLPDRRILFVVQEKQIGRLQVLPDTLAGAPKDFGPAPVEGREPHLTPDRQFVIFRQGTAIVRANLAGTTFTPLIQDKHVLRLFGVLPGEDAASYNLVFAAQKPEIAIEDLWVANIQGAAVRQVTLLPYSSRWHALAAVSMYNTQMLYEFQDTTNAGQPVWNIYLTSAPEEVGQKLTASFYLTKQSLENLRNEGIPENIIEALKPIVNQEVTGEENFLNVVKERINQKQKECLLKLNKDEYQNRYPAWSLDGAQIVYVSNREK